MADSEAPDTDSVERLVELLAERLRESELAILRALAEAEGSLTVPELAEATGYTERTVKKRIDTLADRVGGESLLKRDEEGNPALHPRFAAAVRENAE